VKAFLIFLAVGGAILYGLLEFTHNALQDGKAENSLAAQTQSSHSAAQHVPARPGSKPKTGNSAGNLSADRCIAHTAEPWPKF
jgi:hypothetical protein